ncbi:MAG: hypothetical protein Q4C04_00785 [Clostridia bacterium]|nr:hypothetical protein [Clostridia bacterium]
MICKECGAYNPDHASYCKVCAANLKEGTQGGAPQAASGRYPAMDDTRPSRGFVRPPIWSAAPVDTDEVKASKEKPLPAEPVYAPEPFVRESEAEQVDLKAEPKDEIPAPVAEEVTPVLDEELHEEPAPVAEEKPPFPALEDEDEAEDEVDVMPDKVIAAPETAHEPEPPTTQWSPREVRKLERQRRKSVQEDEEDDLKAYKKYAENEDEDEELEEDEYDEYEYVPTPPRKKKSKQKKGGSSKLFWFLLGTLILVILIGVGFVVYYVATGRSSELPGFLSNINCAGEPVTDGTPDPNATADATQDPSGETPTSDNNNIQLSRETNESGDPCISFIVTLQPGETLTLELPNRDPEVITNSDTTAKSYEPVIPESCYWPNTPLESAVYTVTPEAYIVGADGVQTTLNLPSFDITFPEITLTLTAPTEIPEEGIMAAEGNVLHIEGTVGEHTVSVYVNDEQQIVYTGGVFQCDYTLQSEEQSETIVIRAEQDNCVSAQTEILATPYVFVPEPMVLTVVQGVDALRASETNKVTIRGTTVPGATLAAVTDNSDAANCGSVSVDALGNYTFDLTFNSNYYGLVNVTISAVKEGHEEASVSCIATRMFDERSDFINNADGYVEIPRPQTMAYLLENADNTALGVRLIATVVETFEQDGYTIVKLSVTSEGTEYTVYTMNQSVRWQPADNIGKRYKVYCSPNGTYGDTGDMFVVTWFALAD